MNLKTIFELHLSEHNDIEVVGFGYKRYEDAVEDLSPFVDSWLYRFYDANDKSHEVPVRMIVFEMKFKLGMDFNYEEDSESNMVWSDEMVTEFKIPMYRFLEEYSLDRKEVEKRMIDYTKELTAVFMFENKKWLNSDEGRMYMSDMYNVQDTIKNKNRFGNKQNEYDLAYLKERQGIQLTTAEKELLSPVIPAVKGEPPYKCYIVDEHGNHEFVEGKYNSWSADNVLREQCKVHKKNGYIAYEGIKKYGYDYTDEGLKRVGYGELLTRYQHSAGGVIDTSVLRLVGDD